MVNMGVHNPCCFGTVGKDMSSNRRWQTFISALFPILILSARAGAIDKTDYDRLYDLQREYLQFEHDILDVRGGAVTRPRELADCFDELSKYVEEIEMSIGFLGTTVFIPSFMVNKSDDQTVLTELNNQASNFLKYVELNRKLVNELAGSCSSSNVVAAKAQDALRLFREASSLVRSMLSTTANNNQRSWH